MYPFRKYSSSAADSQPKGSQPKKLTRRRRPFDERLLKFEPLESRVMLASNLPFSPVLGLEATDGVIFDSGTGAISQWQDQSVQGNDLRSAGSDRPTIGVVQTPSGLDAIRFDGIDDRLLRDLNDSSGINGLPTNNRDRSMFLVAQFHDAVGWGGAAYGRGTINQTFGTGVSGTSAGIAGTSTAEEGQLLVQGWYNENDLVVNEKGFDTPGVTNGWMLLSVVHNKDNDNPADNVFFYQNGVQIASWDHKFNTKLISTLDLNGNTSARLVLGEEIKEFGHIELDIAAWVVYDQALSTIDQRIVETYLTDKYLGTSGNQSPVAVDDVVNIDSGATVVIDLLANDFDPDGVLAPQRVSLVDFPQQASGMAINLLTGQVTYTHNGSSQSDSFTYTVLDDEGAVSNVATVTINIGSSNNQAPVATDDTKSINNGSATVIDILANDTDADGSIDPTSVTIIDQPGQAASLSVNPVTGAVTYTHDGSGSPDSFTYTVNDNQGTVSNLATVSISLTTGTLVIEDTDPAFGPNSLTVDLANGLSFLDLSVTEGMSYNDVLADPNFAGYRHATAAEITNLFISAGITAINELPFQSTSFAEAQTLSLLLGLTHNETGNSPATMGVSDDSALIQDNGPPIVRYTPYIQVNLVSQKQRSLSSAALISQVGHARLMIADNASSSSTGHWLVKSLSPSPQAVNDSVTILDGATVSIDVVANDFTPNGAIDPTTVTIVVAPNRGTLNGVDPVTGEVSYTHDGSGLPATFTYTVNDDQGLVTNVATVTISISSTSQLVATSDLYSVVTGETLDTASHSLLTALFNDHDGTPGDGNDLELAAVLVTPPTHGTLTLDPSGHFIYAHDGSSATTDSFTYRAINGAQNSNIASVDIQIVDGANLNVVRWHGDYYQHKWISGVPGGTLSEFKENRWLRGGPALGSQHSTLNLDLDNDGTFDDSQVYFDFSLTDPLSPRDTPQRPNGVFYHSDLPSAQFYGGLSTNFYNYQTVRVDQAFIENDGAGGEAADVGYVSPYVSAEHQSFRDFVELVRHTDGSSKKNHIGVQEDFAIDLYRDGRAHPVDPNEDASDDLTTFAGAFIWKKEDFLNAGDSNTVSLDSNSVFSFESTRWWDNVEQARWIIQDGNGSLYISQFSVSGALDLWGQKNELIDPLSSQWAVYSPSVNEMEFDAAAAIFVDPVAAGLFTDIQAFGIHVAQTVPSAGNSRFSLDEIRFDAVVTKASAALAAQLDTLPSTPLSILTGLTDVSDEGIWNSAFEEIEEEEEAVGWHEETTSSKSTDDAIAFWDEVSRQRFAEGEESDEEVRADDLSLSFWESLSILPEEML